MEKIITTWAALYDKLWSETLTSIADEYKITYSELKALIQEHHIPAPPNGYWSKLKAGYRIEKTPPPSSSVLEKVIEFTPKERRKKGVPVAKTEHSGIIKPVGKPDRLIDLTKKSFREKKRMYNNDDIVYLGWDALEIRVTSPAMERALTVFDLFIKNVRAIGGKVALNGSRTMATVKDEDFQIAIREKYRRIVKNPDAKHSYDKYGSVPTGTLVFKIGSGSYNAMEWKDGKLKLEEVITDIVDNLLRAADRRKAARIESERRQAARELQRQQERELDARKDAEVAKLNSLASQAERWQRSRLIRDYLSQVEMAAKQEHRYDDSVKDFVVWGNEKADWLDPFKNRIDDLLDDVNKSTMSREKKGYW